MTLVPEETRRRLQSIIAARFDGDEEEAARVYESTLRRIEWRRGRGHRVCGSCRQPKRVAAFGVDSRNPDGLHRVCRRCRSVLS